MAKRKFLCVLIIIKLVDWSSSPSPSHHHDYFVWENRSLYSCLSLFSLTLAVYVNCCVLHKSHPHVQYVPRVNRHLLLVFSPCRGEFAIPPAERGEWTKLPTLLPPLALLLTQRVQPCCPPGRRKTHPPPYLYNPEGSFLLMSCKPTGWWLLATRIDFLADSSPVQFYSISLLGYPLMGHRLFRDRPFSSTTTLTRLCISSRVNK